MRLRGDGHELSISEISEALRLLAIQDQRGLLGLVGCRQVLGVVFSAELGLEVVVFSRHEVGLVDNFFVLGLEIIDLLLTVLDDSLEILALHAHLVYFIAYGFLISELQALYEFGFLLSFL